MKTLYTAVEKAHYDALTNARRAIRAGDLAKAERWLKLSILHWKSSNAAQAEAAEIRTRLREIRQAKGQS